MEFEPKFEKPSERERKEVEREKRERVEGVNRDDEKYEEYWKNYGKESTVQRIMDDIVSLNRDAAHLYETTERKQEARLNHVIWIYNNPEKLIPVYKAISQQEWKDLTDKPEVIEKVGKLLIESYNSAINFYNWRDKPKGFVIEGSKNFGMQAGNIAGVRISYQEITPLIKAIETKDQEETEIQKKYIAASIVHELTHQEREDGLVSFVKTEIASHIVQFIFNPRDNEIFNKQIEYSLNRIAERRNSEEAKEQKPIHLLYDKARYIALLIIANELTQHNEEYHDILQNDKDSHKLMALRKLQENISPENEKYLKSDVLQKIIQTNNDELVTNLIEIEELLGIQRSIIEIE